MLGGGCEWFEGLFDLLEPQRSWRNRVELTPLLLCLTNLSGSDSHTRLSSRSSPHLWCWIIVGEMLVRRWVLVARARWLLVMGQWELHFKMDSWRGFGTWHYIQTLYISAILKHSTQACGIQILSCHPVAYSSYSIFGPSGNPGICFYHARPLNNETNRRSHLSSNMDY